VTTRRGLRTTTLELLLLLVLMTPAVRIDMLERGLFEAFATALPDASVTWGRSSVPQEQLRASWLSLQVLEGPSPFGWSRARGTPVRAIESATVTIDADAEEGDCVVVIVNLQRFRYDLLADEGPEEARDALVDAINEWLEPYGISAAAVAVDPEADPPDPVQLTITRENAVDLWSVAVAGACSFGTPTEEDPTPGLVYVDPADDDAVLEFTSGLYMARVEASCFGKEPVHGALSLATTAQHSLLTPALAETLYDRYDIGLAERSNKIVDLSAIADAYWESRSAFTFGCYMRGNSVRVMDTIETINLRMRVSTRVEELVITVPFSL
jgi:hypothetical protein